MCCNTFICTLHDGSKIFGAPGIISKNNVNKIEITSFLFGELQ